MQPKMPWQRVALVAVVATVGSILPAFLVGALGVQIADDLDIGAGGLGVAIGAYFVGAALLSARMGRLVEQIGPERAMRIATATSAVTMVLVALLAHELVVLVVLLIVAGGAQALGQPATNLLIARGAPASHQGIAFAIKQSGMPLGTLLGGAAVPLVALTLGWRWAFVGGAGLALAAFALVPPTGTFPGVHRTIDGDAHRAEARPFPMAPLLLMSLAVGLGAASAGSVVSFYVSGAVSAGVSESVAGWALTAGSAIGIAMRLWQGLLADRRGRRHLPVVATMLAVGALGHLMFALTEPWLYIAAIPIAFGAGWAWPGLFNLAVVRNYPDAPGAATGVSQTGTYLGAVLGPVVFGLLVDASGYGLGWCFSAACAALAAAMMIVARRQLLAHRAGAVATS
jgi:predicted MFS family arabinose efflux permease